MKIVTHGGNFHTDDIFAVGVLSIVYPDAEFIRTRDEDAISSADLVVDVGGVYDPENNRFDHHQEGGAGFHPEGIPMASFGLVWKHFGEKIAQDNEVHEEIRKRIVLFVDAIDNGISVSKPILDNVREYSIHNLFRSFIEDEEGDEQLYLEAFMKSVDLAKGIIEREVIRLNTTIPGLKEAAKIAEQEKDNEIVVLEKNIPWMEAFSKSEKIMYVVYPRKDGKWGVQAVRKDPRSFDVRKLLPERWARKNAEELREMTGVKDAIFAHGARYMAVAESKEGALELAKLALND